MRRVAACRLALCVASVLAGTAAWGQAKPAVLCWGWPELQREFAQYLVDNGFEANQAEPTAERLKAYNVLVLLQGGATGPQLEALLDYVRQGGGLFLEGYKGQHTSDFDPQFELLDRLDACVLPETITDTAHAVTATPWGVTFAWTRQIAPSSVSDGVGLVWFPVAGDLGSLSMTLPYEFGAPWQVVVRGEQSSRSTPYDFGAALPKQRTRPQGYAESVPFYGIRPYGQGRVALCGINNSFLFSGGFARALERVVVDKGLSDRPSDAGRLVLNTLRWLAEPSLRSGAFGGAKTPESLLHAAAALQPAGKIDWTDPKFGPPPRLFHGALGARTSLSVGHGTVADYAQAARAQGLDFAIFAEDFKELTPEEWQTLKQQCAAATDDRFAAVPGFAIEDVYGDHYFVAGTEVKYPEPDLLTADGKRLTDAYAQGGVPGPGNLGIVWLEYNYTRGNFQAKVGSYWHSANPIPYYSFRAYDSVGLVTQYQGQTLDQLDREYLHLVNRGEHLMPWAVTLLDSPDDLARVAKNEYYRTICEAGSLAELVQMISSHHPAMPGYNNLWQVTNGPVVREWRFLGPRDYSTWQWFRPDYNRWRPRLVVQSDVGVQEVIIFDGQEVFRRFAPRGAKEFTWESDLSHDQQHNLVVRATDTKGRRCYTSELYDRTHLLEEFMCGDRMNQLSYSGQRWPDDGTFAQSGFVWGMTPNKGPWNLELAPVATYKPDHKLGGSVPGFDGAPGGDPLVWLGPSVRCDQGAEDLRRCQMVTDRVLHSADVMLGEGRTDGLYPDQVQVTNVWHTMAPTTPTKLLDARLRRTYFNIRPGLLSSTICELAVTAKQALTNARLALGSFGRGAAPRWYVRDGEATVSGDANAPIPEAQRQGTLEGGDYLAWCGAPLGSVAIFNLGDDPIAFDFWSLDLPLPDGKAAAGQAARATLLTVGAPFTVRGDNGWVEDFRAKLGLAGKPGYDVRVESGAVLSQRYILRVDGRGQGFAGTISRADLPIALPILVENLCPNWSVGLYDRAGQRYRPLGQVGGTAYATVDANEGDLRLFIGHPVVASSRNLRLTATQTGDRQFSVEVHNPTTGRIEATLSPTKVFTLVKPTPQRVTVEPGSSQWLSFQG